MPKLPETTVNDHDDAIVRSMVELATRLHLRIVAEGVETRETEEALRRIGCDVVQGYLLSRALSPGDLERWLAVHDHEREARRGAVRDSCRDGHRIARAMPPGLDLAGQTEESSGADSGAGSWPMTGRRGRPRTPQNTYTSGARNPMTAASSWSVLKNREPLFVRGPLVRPP